MKKSKKIKAELVLNITSSIDKILCGEINLDSEELLQGTSFIIGKKYRVVDLKSGDNFGTVGYVTEGLDFIATYPTPLAWVNGSIVERQFEELLTYQNDIDNNVSVALIGGNNVELKITNNGFVFGKTLPNIFGGSFINVVDANTISFNKQIGVKYFKVEILN